VPGLFLGLFNRESDIIIPWKDIVNIGVDVILVEYRETIEMERE